MAAATGNDLVVTLSFELIGVAALALLAGAGPNIGKVVVILMVGFALAWALAHTTWLQQNVGNKI
jgi:hypothetical protein